MARRILSRDFYERDPGVVAKELLGKRLIRRWGEGLLEGVVVESEAYYGLEDPASRAYHGMKRYNRGMWGEPGKAFIYNVHRYWMFNIVAHEPKRIGAVLIRALEPTRGVRVMRRNRGVKNKRDLTSGPGKLTLALNIDKRFEGVAVTSTDSEIFVAASDEHPGEIESSRRIGVGSDLEKDLRFYIRGNDYLSR